MAEQSSFLDLIEIVPAPVKTEYEVVTEYLEFPRLVANSLNCPSCRSRIQLRPDGSAICPKCVIKIPYSTLRKKGETSGKEKANGKV